MSPKGLLRLTLILCVFLAQWGLFAHEYQDHDAAHSCEICVGASTIAHALPASGPEMPAPARFGRLVTPAEVHQPSLPPLRRYSVRAPPSVLS